MVRTLCHQYGFDVLLPVDNNETSPQKIFESNLALIRKAQIVCANLDPFRGTEPDSGTAFEVGYAYALGKKVCGYVSKVQTAKERLGLSDERPAIDDQGWSVEDFGLPCNLMLSVPSNIVVGGLEECLKSIRTRNPPPTWMPQSPQS